MGDSVPAVSKRVVEAAQTGDRNAIESLVRALYPFVLRWALVRTGSPDDAEDITQDVMISISRNIVRFNGKSAVTTWAYRITANAVAGRFRMKTRLVPMDEIEESSLAGSEADPQKKIDRNNLSDLVMTFFDKLPDRQREVFNLADLQGFRASEIAEMLKMNPVTVRAHLHRARRSIRKKILDLNPALDWELEG